MGSPSPAGSHNRSRRDRDSFYRRDDDYRRDDRHRDRDREKDKDRDYRRRRSRSRSPVDHRRYRDRRDRDRDRERERDRGGRRDARDRRRSPDRRRSRSRESQRSHGHKIEEVRRPSSVGDGGNGREVSKTATPAPIQSEADKKAERLLRLEAWKKKMESKGKEKTEEAGQAQKSQVDEKAAESPSIASPAVESPGPESVAASPATPYAGKFDPKAIAKKSAASRPQTEPEVVAWGSIGNNKGAVPPAAVKQAPTASALPANRGNLSKFGFQKQNEKLPSKRKLILDEEETSKRQLTKLPTLPIESDDTPYADQDEGEESDGVDIFAENEEEAAAAARAAHERREGRMQVDPQPEQKDIKDDDPKPESIEVEAANDQMEVDDDVDPLDVFMADLQDKGFKRPKQAAVKKDQPEPEAYFSDDEYTHNDGGDPNAKVILAINAKRKKKDIPTHNYSKLELPPVRKNFWVEPAELSGLTEAEANELRMELDGIKVVGKDVPKPVQKWAQCGLTRQTLDTIERLGFEKPTPVQMQAIPAIMSGRDVIAVAKTGSGKTLAFLLPMFRHIMDQDPLKETDGPIGLIIAPTRELATQIHRDCKPFLKAMKLRAVCTYGGAPIKDQIAELKRGAEIIVCTPGRLFDILAANQGRVTNLKRITYAVMDEADRMFDMGFEPQIMKIFANMRPDRQTILFSATMPRIVDNLTKKVLQRPIEITVGGRSVVASEITQVVEVRQESTKFLRVLELLGELYDKDEDARTLLFVDRQDKADDLLKDLMLKGYPCMSIHGGKDQVDRDSTISDFKKGIVPILIATSVAARGLDVKQLKLVVNYDAPNHLEDYVHRAGRTGRAGNTGTAVTFVTDEQENCAAAIAKALEQSSQPVPERLDEIRKAHWEKVKSGKSKDITGFGGRGLTRLDEERELARLRERKTHKAEGEEEDFKEDKPSEGDRTQKAVSSINVAASAIIARDAPKSDSKPVADVDISAVVSSKNPLDKVSSAVSAINSRLGKAGQLRTGQPIDNKGPDAGAYHATLPINDFPQKARWAVTNRTNVAKILEATGTSITTKGSFYPAGKEVPTGGDPKLYILIEGDTEVVVGSALAELKRLLLEGTMAAADAEGRAPTSGRYTVT